MPKLSKGGKHIFKMNRTATQRWHLLRTLVTQLITHERIKSTTTKCKSVRPLAEKVITLAKRVSEYGDLPAKRRIQGILTTPLARKKVVMEIAPRFKDRNCNFTRIKLLFENRKGDCAPMGYIECLGNELEQYEKTLQKERYEKGLEPNKDEWKMKIFKEERDFFQQKLEQAEEDLKVKSIELQEKLHKGEINKEELARKEMAIKVTRDFFQKKLQRVEYDLFLCNKNKYDLIKYVNI